jgi:hypothetical protein
MPVSSTQESYFGRVATQLTPARLAPYLKAEKGDLGRALARYYWNVELCRCYYPVLQALEVALRNNLDRAIAPRFPVARFQDIDSWLDRIPAVAIHPGAEGALSKAKDNIRYRDPGTGDYVFTGKVHGDLLAATSFGFWVGLLESYYDQPGTRGIALWGTPLTPGLERQVFPGAAGVTMSSIRSAFSQIRHFRNRVFHHEPVWPKRLASATSSGDPLPKERYDAIVTALRWVGGEQAKIPPALHGTPEPLVQEVALPAMHSRLIATVDELIERSERRNREKAQRKEARSAAKDARHAGLGEPATPPGPTVAGTPPAAPSPAPE